MVLKFPEEGSLPLQPNSHLSGPQKTFFLVFLFSVIFSSFSPTAQQINSKNSFFSFANNDFNNLKSIFTNSVETSKKSVHFVHYKPQLFYYLCVIVQFLIFTQKIFSECFLMHRNLALKHENKLSMQNFQCQSFFESRKEPKNIFFYTKKPKTKNLSESHFFHLKLEKKFFWI